MSVNTGKYSLKNTLKKVLQKECPKKKKAEYALKCAEEME